MAGGALSALSSLKQEIEAWKAVTVCTDG